MKAGKLASKRLKQVIDSDREDVELNKEVKEVKDNLERQGYKIKFYLFSFLERLKNRKS